MNNYLKKYLKYKSKYQLLKIQKGGAKLGNITAFGIILGELSDRWIIYNKKVGSLLLYKIKESDSWIASKHIDIPSKKEIMEFIEVEKKRPEYKDAKWYNFEEEIKPLQKEITE
jgi:hypothetical protein